MSCCCLSLDMTGTRLCTCLNTVVVIAEEEVDNGVFCKSRGGGGSNDDDCNDATAFEPEPG